MRVVPTNSQGVGPTVRAKLISFVQYGSVYRPERCGDHNYEWPWSWDWRRLPRMRVAWIWVASLTAARDCNWATMPLLLARLVALRLGCWSLGAPMSTWGPNLAVTLPVRPATPLRRKCPTASDAEAAEVGDASKNHARLGWTGHLQLK